MSVEQQAAVDLVRKARSKRLSLTGQDEPLKQLRRRFYRPR